MSLPRDRFNVHIQPLLHRTEAVIQRIVDDIAVLGIHIEFVENLLTVEKCDRFAAEIEVIRQIVRIEIDRCFGRRSRVAGGGGSLFAACSEQ